MHSPTTVRVLSVEEAAALAPQQVVNLSLELAAARQQLDWFKRQLFGQKSERRVLDTDSVQLNLGELIGQGQEQDGEPASRVIAAHQRRVATKAPGTDTGDESLPFFDAARVPVEVIEVPAPEAQGLSPEDYQVISYKDSYRLAQRPGSYVVLQYRRPVIKRRDSTIACAPAPMSVIEGSRAEVSFVAGVLIDKFAYHLPLYRQHQRLTDAGITVSRAWLTQIVHQAASLLEPIYEALFASIRGSRVKAMDETPIKAGRSEAGKMKAAYYWPVYAPRR